MDICASTAPAPALDERAVFALTPSGKRSLDEAGTTLSAVQLEALVLVDGHSTPPQILGRVPEENRGEIRAAMVELLERGYIGVDADPFDGVIDAGDFFSAGARATPAAGREEHAIADTATEFLRRNGYCVTIARNLPAPEGRPKDRALTVLVVDDDPDIGGLLGRYLKLEGILTRTAARPDEIVAALRQLPVPDLVLLDVHLPGVDGYLCSTGCGRIPS